MTDFGRIMMGLVALVVVVALAGLAWFGFRFVQDNILEDGNGNGGQDEIDRDIERVQTEICLEQARRAKGTGQFTYRTWSNIFPFCATVVSLRDWQAI